MTYFLVGPEDKTKQQPGSWGYSVTDMDTNRDGILECTDSCKEDKDKTTSLGQCGCRVSGMDMDEDGVPGTLTNVLWMPPRRNLARVAAVSLMRTRIKTMLLTAKMDARRCHQDNTRKCSCGILKWIQIRCCPNCNDGDDAIKLSPVNAAVAF